MEELAKRQKKRKKKPVFFVFVKTAFSSFQKLAGEGKDDPLEF